MSTKKKLLVEIQQKYGLYSVNEFTKKCYEYALAHKDFFFDVLTGVLGEYYTSNCKYNSDSFRG